MKNTNKILKFFTIGFFNTLASFNIFLIILILQLLNIENICLSEYSLLFNTTIINHFKFYSFNAAAGGKKVDTSVKVEPIVNKSEPTTEKTEKTESSIFGGNVNSLSDSTNNARDIIKTNIFKNIYTKILTFVYTTKAKLSMYMLHILNNKLYYYFYKFIKFSLWLIIYWFAAIGLVMLHDYNIKHGIDHSIIYNLYESIKIHIYETHQNVLIYMKECIENWITIDKNNSPNITKPFPKTMTPEAVKQSYDEYLENLSRRSINWGILDDANNDPFYKSPYFYVPVILVAIGILGYYNYTSIMEYLKHIKPGGLGGSSDNDYSKKGNLPPQQ